MKKSLIFGSGASACKDYSGLLAVCRTALGNGITSFDTAPSYRTEEIISKAVRQVANETGLTREDYQIQTKIDPIQMFEGRVVEYFKRKLDAMSLDYVDALLIHWPVLNYLERTWDDMQCLKEHGLTKQIGICNLRISNLEEFYDKGTIPEILQIERHPLNTFEREIEFCKKYSITIQDYSPLCKMHPRIRESKALQEIADRHHCDIGRLILRWHIDTGATPIFTSTKPERVSLYAQTEEIQKLDEDEIKIISSLNCNHKLYLESLICPGI